MSSYVDREWFYYLKGRNIHLYKLLGGSSSERITQSGVIKTLDRELMYPNEDIADGLRIEYTALNEPYISEALETTTGYASGTGISFGDGTAVISDSDSGFAATGKAFAQGDKIRIQGSASNDGDYTLSSSETVNASTLTVTGDTFTLEPASERITITQISLEDSSPSETSHPNLNRMLSLACVDYLKAQIADKRGDIQLKEYYMREFWKKVGDNESNKRKISMTYPVSPYAVR
jgi:hypothetical protein|tara:strand:- start:86 stop:787 length:702 start_codon:yes stop_codon:yes gene_type:complete